MSEHMREWRWRRVPVDLWTRDLSVGATWLKTAINSTEAPVSAPPASQVRLAPNLTRRHTFGATAQPKTLRQQANRAVQNGNTWLRIRV